jgi:hypothetical protein
MKDKIERKINEKKVKIRNWKKIKIMNPMKKLKIN